jgi:hypothetical protein
LLAKLSRDRLETRRLNAQPNTWVGRTLDRLIAKVAPQAVVFVIAESGLGKRVACWKRLEQHIDSGGFGLILPHETIASSLVAEQATDSAFRQLHPHLVQYAGRDALTLCSTCRPFVAVIEDINKWGQARFLAEKIAKWVAATKADSKPSESSAVSTDRRKWWLLCPLWPSMGTESAAGRLSVGDEHTLSGSKRSDGKQNSTRIFLQVRNKVLRSGEGDFASDSADRTKARTTCHFPKMFPKRHISKANSKPIY